MATTTTTTTTTQLKPNPKCRRSFLETTITTTSSPATSSQPPITTTSLPPPLTTHIATSSSSSPLNLKTSNIMDPYSNGYYPTSLNKFNNALTAGLLNPHSPPPPLPKATRSSPTLFEMMANEPDSQPQKSTPPPQNDAVFHQNIQNSQKGSVLDRQALLQQKLIDLVGSRSPGNRFNDVASSDVKLKLSGKDGLSVVMNVHREILVGHSRFFCEKLGVLGVKQRPYDIEIADCDDVEVYVETLRLMYCRDLRRWLMREDVTKVLGILKVSAAIGFDAGVLSCLEYLEAAPWAEDEEEKVASLLSELQLERFGAREVLKRVSFDVVSGHETRNDNEEVLLKLLHVVLEGKDEKARREMKQLVCKMLRESSSKNDLRKESLYLACDECLEMLRNSFVQVADSNFQNVSQIARQADNLRWILDIMIDRQIADDFLMTWSSQSQLSEAHSKVPPLHRYEVSNVTARLFVGIGKGQLLASKDARCMLMKTWLVPFYDDFGWMRRASRGLDRHLIEEGLTNAILTLPISWQQEIFISWFNRFLNSGDDCPNIQRGFETWWKRAFWRRNNEPDRPRQLRIMNGTVQNS